MHPFSSYGYLGDSGAQILLSQSSAPHQLKAQDKQGVVFSFQSADTFSEVQDAQGAVGWERHEEREAKFKEAARNVTLIRASGILNIVTVTCVKIQIFKYLNIEH